MNTLANTLKKDESKILTEYAEISYHFLVCAEVYQVERCFSHE